MAPHIQQRFTADEAKQFKVASGESFDRAGYTKVKLQAKQLGLLAQRG
jgi:hypothetical protein